MSKTILKSMRPAVFDGFTFLKDAEDGTLKFLYFDELTREYGPFPRDPNTPLDREAYHVVLSSIRKGRIHVERPFTSNFIDVFAYAEHVFRSGFTGVMIRVNKYSLLLLEQTLAALLIQYKNSYGFVMTDDQGVDVFHAGRKQEKRS